MSKIDPNEARQAKKGKPVLIVLIAGLALAIIAFIGMGIYGGTQPDENIGGAEQGGISTESAAPSEAAPAGATVDPSTTPASPPAAN